MATLYLKYRPQKISDLDLTDVREHLQKIVASGDIPHALLFEGPRGSGKTSAARIIAKVVNCTNLSKEGEPCGKCDQCKSITKGSNIDVIELDAASHRGIDDVRLIRDSVKLSPAKAKKKVYIIDEAHMLTTEASNALLKTLEEPPQHVVFILATTNPEKLLDTIKSRTIRINFKKGTVDEIVKSLKNVLETESKKYDEKVLQLISKSVDGSFRDAKKILEEILLKDYINDLENAENFLLNKADFNIVNFLEVVNNKDLKKAVQLLDNSEKAGVPASSVRVQVINALKEILFVSIGYSATGISDFSKNDAMKLLDIFITYWGKYKNDVSEYLPFYLAVCDWCGDSTEVSRGSIDVKNTELSDNKISEVDRSTENTKAVDGVPDGNHQNLSVDVLDGVTNVGNNMENRISGLGEDNISDSDWKKILQVVRSKNPSTEALLRASRPMGLNGNTLSLGVYYKFHKEKLESNPHKMCLEDCLVNVVGGRMKVECFLTEPDVNTKNGKTDISNGVSLSENDSGKDVILSETDEDADLIKLAEEVFGS